MVWGTHADETHVIAALGLSSHACRTVTKGNQTYYVYVDPQGYFNMQQRLGHDDEWTQPIGRE